ncbi:MULTISPECIES: hypothetical protein [unclassified Pseudomonas]|uniref:hypothetical protein n=1 Tax=unclassified Pseudomonas TaxID=196821 RepID=UPI001CBD3C80|nr:MULTISPECIES: hypothetical protein [unclassified Pseudomonas]
MRTVGSKQLPFAFALMSTRLAMLVKQGELSVLRARLDRPTATTMNSLYVKTAKKGNPEARTFFKDAWASGVPAETYLQQAVKGGRRPHKRFEKALIARGIMKSGQYAIPAASALNPEVTMRMRFTPRAESTACTGLCRSVVRPSTATLPFGPMFMGEFIFSLCHLAYISQNFSSRFSRARVAKASDGSWWREDK